MDEQAIGFLFQFSSLHLDCISAIQKVPIFHAMGLLTSLAAMYTGSIVLAGIVGLLAAMLQELCARMFYNHGSNHLDPPAAAILFGTLILDLLFKPQFLNLSRYFRLKIE